jgi:transposase
MPQPNDLSRSLVALDQNSTIIAVVELSQSSWLVGGVVPGIERQPREKLEPSSGLDKVHHSDSVSVLAPGPAVAFD